MIISKQGKILIHQNIKDNTKKQVPKESFANDIKSLKNNYPLKIVIGANLK